MDNNKLTSQELSRIETLFYQAGIKDTIGEIEIKKKKFVIFFILFLILCFGLLILLGYFYAITNGKVSPLYLYLIFLFGFVGSISIYYKYDYKGDSRIFNDKLDLESTKVTSKIDPKAYKVIDESAELLDIEDITSSVDNYYLGLKKLIKGEKPSSDLNDYSDLEFDVLAENREKIKKYFYDCYFPIITNLGNLLKWNLLKNVDYKYFDNIFNYKFLNISGEEKNIVGFNYWTYYFTKKRTKGGVRKVRQEVDNVGFLFSNSSHSFKEPAVLTYKFNLDDKKSTASIYGGIIILILWYVLIFNLPILGFLIDINEILGGFFVFLCVFIVPYFVIKYFNKFLVQLYLEKIKGVSLEEIKNPSIEIKVISNDIELKQKIENNLTLKKEIKDLTMNGYPKFKLIFIDNNVFLDFRKIESNKIFFNYDFGKNLEKNILRYQIQGNKLKKTLNFMKKIEEIV